MLIGLIHHTSSRHGHRASLPAVHYKVTIDAKRFALLRSLSIDSDALDTLRMSVLHFLQFVIESRQKACHALVILRRSRDQLRPAHPQLLFPPSCSQQPSNISKEHERGDDPAIMLSEYVAPVYTEA